MDPLAQLKDIHLPDPIHNYPIAIGWWLLLVVVIVLITLVLIKLLKRRKRLMAKRIAMQQLNHHVQDNDDIVVTLKWAASQYFPRAEIAKLYGQPLVDYLAKHLPEKYQDNFISTASKGLTLRYQLSEATIDDQLLEAAKLWVSSALPPSAKPSKKGEAS
ncbi:DUF4381 domain-containing protein [Thalassotalea ganghwensis]